jgi:hypothetical protein
MSPLYGKLRSILVVATVLPLVACLSGGGGGNSGTTSSAAPGPAPSTCSSVTYAAPSGAANNIVFTFDKAYTCGQFANGDWWVSKDANPSVTITSITPAASGGENGFEVNPTSKTQQAFDNDVVGVTYNAGLMPALPLSLTGVSSVVKAVSMPVSGLPELRFAAVLTVVDAPISNSSEVFRPGYFGTAGKTFYPVPTAATIAALPVGTYTPVGVPSAAGFSIASIAARYQHVQLDHSPVTSGRDLHPADNMPDYGAEIARDNAVYLLRMLLSDFNYSNATHKQALINYLQMAIDFKSITAGGHTYGADAGHGLGRKLPLMFANMVFGGTDFSNAIAVTNFSEVQQIWRSGVTGEVLWGKPPFGDPVLDYWKTTRIALGDATAGTGGAKDVRDPYDRIDGGGYQVGVTSEYQACCTSMPWKYTVLAQYMLGLTTPPTTIPNAANDNMAEYVERWVRYGYKAADTTTNINLTTGVITPVAHGLPVCARPAVPSAAVWLTDYGSVGAGPCIVGVNNWGLPVGGVDNTSADSGGYGNAFGDELWAWYR